MGSADDAENTTGADGAEDTTGAGNTAGAQNTADAQSASASHLQSAQAALPGRAQLDFVYCGVGRVVADFWLTPIRETTRAAIRDRDRAGQASAHAGVR